MTLLCDYTDFWRRMWWRLAWLVRCQRRIERPSVLSLYIDGATSWGWLSAVSLWHFVRTCLWWHKPGELKPQKMLNWSSQVLICALWPLGMLRRYQRVDQLQRSRETQVYSSNARFVSTIDTCTLWSAHLWFFWTLCPSWSAGLRVVALVINLHLWCCFICCCSSHKFALEC